MTSDNEPTEIKEPGEDGNGSPQSRVAREGERPIWRVTLELNLRRDFASEADMMKVYAALAADTTNADLQDLYTRTLNVYQQRQGQIEDLYIAEKYDRKDNWAVFRTVKHRPDRVPVLRRFPFFRSSSVDWFFAIEAAQPPDVAAAFSSLNDLGVKSEHVLRGTDQVSFNRDLAVAFENVIGELADAKGQPLPSDEVARVKSDVVRLNALWKAAALRGLPITTLEGMGIGAAVVTLLSIGVGLLLRSASIADFRVATFVGVVVAGGVGAIISVLTRMSMGTFVVPIDTARTNVRILGAIRPMIGATFAVVIVFGLIGQLLGVQTVVNDDHRFYAYIVFAFLSGFSERWARNLLSGVAKTVGANGAGAEASDHEPP